jgi:hypothetical protein
MKKILISIFLLSFFNLFAQSAGNTGLSFLKFGFGARNIAMGDAGSVASNDMTALFYNPARLTQSESNEALFMHSEWIQDVRSEVGGLKWNMFSLPFAIGFNVTTISDIEVRDRPGDPVSKFNANYFYGSLSTGFNIAENLDAGLSVKYLYEGILNDESKGFGFDIGANYLTSIKGLSVSAVLRNIGSMNKLRNESSKLPTELRAGGEYQFGLEESKFDFVIAGEFHKYLDTDDTHFNFGGDIVYNKLIALRVGYQTGYISRDFTGGIGLMWGSLKFDYAYLPFSEGLGNSNLFSVQFKF